MSKKYRIHKRAVSQSKTQESKRLIRQTYLFIATTIGLIFIIIFVGIPALIKFAIFLGDLRGSSSPITSEDTIPPAPPQITTLPQTTSVATLNITGFSEPGATIQLFHQNSFIEETIALDDGQFEFLSVSLDPDDNHFYTQAIDTSGNKSSASKTQNITLDSQAPDLSIFKPNNNQHFFGISERTIEISGGTDPNTQVTINDRLAVVNSSGEFSLKVQLEEGDNHFTVTATDTAGNQMTDDLTVNYSP